MPATPNPPFHPSGLKFTADPTHDLSYVQELHDNDPLSIYRGQLFLNEPNEEIYYVDADGRARAIPGVLAYNAVLDSDFGSEGLLRRDAESGAYSVIIDNSENWNIAYSWGDHSTQGYLSISLSEDVTLDQVIKFDGTNWVNSDSLTLRSVSLSDGTDETKKEEVLEPIVIDGGLTYSLNLGPSSSFRYAKIGLLSNDEIANEFGYEEIKLIHDGLNIVSSYIASESIYSGITSNFTDIVSASIVDDEIILEIGNATVNPITINLNVKKLLNTSIPVLQPVV